MLIMIVMIIVIFVHDTGTSAIESPAALEQVKPLSTSALGVCVLNVFLNILPNVLFAYCISFLFSSADTAFRIVPSFYSLVSVLPSLAVNILYGIGIVTPLGFIDTL